MADGQRGFPEWFDVPDASPTASPQNRKRGFRMKGTSSVLGAAPRRDRARGSTGHRPVPRGSGRSREGRRDPGGVASSHVREGPFCDAHVRKCTHRISTYPVWRAQAPDLSRVLARTSRSDLAFFSPSIKS